MEEEKPKSNRGGARPGAGRKPKYDIKQKYKRVQVKPQHYDIIKSIISMLDNAPEKIKMDYEHTPCMFNSSVAEEKHIGEQKWIDFDAIKSVFPLTILQRVDLRIFALAWYVSRPYGVKINLVNDDKVRLKWNCIEEVINLMMCYGFLLGVGEQRLMNYKGTGENIYTKLQQVLKEIPTGEGDPWRAAMYKWIKKIDCRGSFSNNEQPTLFD